MTSKKRILLISIAIVIGISFVGCGDNDYYNDNSKIAEESDTFGLSESRETIESGVYKGKFKLSGDGTIWTYESDTDFDLQVPYSLSVKSGKAKIVLIYNDSTVIDLVENTEKSTMDEPGSIIVPIKKGKNRIKIAGYQKADIDIELQIDRGKLAKISF